MIPEMENIEEVWEHAEAESLFSAERGVGAAVVASGEQVGAGGEPDEAAGRLGGLRKAGGVWVGIRVEERAVGVIVFTHAATIAENN